MNVPKPCLPSKIIMKFNEIDGAVQLMQGDILDELCQKIEANFIGLDNLQPLKLNKETLMNT
ncbi:MAG: hypothetical protein ACFC03_02650 [Candidatus Malihini olakiniferum]